MRRAVTVLTLAVGGLLVAGCAYDPYSGTYAPCCSYYGNPYGYRYPTPYNSPYAYQAAPYSPAPPAQPGSYPYQPAPYGQPPQALPSGGPYQTPPYQPAPYAQPPQALSQPGANPYQPVPLQPYATPDAATDPERGGWIAERFAMANTAHDGRLTREQAAAGMPFVADNFDAIDVERKGFVTLPEVRTFAEYRRAAGGQPVGPSVQ